MKLRFSQHVTLFSLAIFLGGCADQSDDDESTMLAYAEESTGDMDDVGASATDATGEDTGLLYCEGNKVTSTSDNISMPRPDRTDPWKNLLVVRPGEPSPIGIVNDDSSTTPLCDYDCAFLGSSDDFSVRRGFSAARNHQVDYGSQSAVLEITYKDGQLEIIGSEEGLTESGVYYTKNEHITAQCSYDMSSVIEDMKADETVSAEEAVDDAEAALREVEAAMEELGL